MKIFIDPGHGGTSIGAAYKGRKETLRSPQDVIWQINGAQTISAPFTETP